MKRSPRAFFDDDSAVSNVVAGVLVFALVMMALVVVRVEFVPAMEKDQEAAHMRTVQGEFLQLRAEAERQATNRTGGLSVSTPLTLSQEDGKWRYFTGSGLPGSLMFDPRKGDATNLSAEELLIFNQDGEDMFGIDEDWRQIKPGETLENISKVQHLRIRANDPGSIAGPPHGEEKGSVTLTVTDADGDFAGDIRVYVMSHPSGYNINTRVRDANQTVLYDQGHAHFNQDQPEFYWVDALAPAAQFRTVLSHAASPFTFTWDQDVLTGHYTISYLEEGENGTVQKGNSGKNVTDWSLEHGAGALMFDSTNRYFLDQDLRLEHGALIVEQAEGATLVGEPEFRASLNSGQTRITTTSVGLSGPPDEVGSRQSVPVEFRATEHATLTATAPAFTWSYPTDHPGLWEDLWRERLASAGLDEGAGEFMISTQPDRATLTVYGTDADPNSDAHDLSLTLRQSTLEVVLPQ